MLLQKTLHVMHYFWYVFFFLYIYLSSTTFLVNFFPFIVFTIPSIRCFCIKFLINYFFNLICKRIVWNCRISGCSRRRGQPWTSEGNLFLLLIPNSNNLLLKILFSLCLTSFLHCSFSTYCNLTLILIFAVERGTTGCRLCSWFRWIRQLILTLSKF